MWIHVLAIASLVILCALWVLFQRLLKRLDPATPSLEERCNGCGSCTKNCGGKN